MKIKLILFGIMLIQATTAQQKVIKLFPQGAPGEKTQLVESGSTDGRKVANKTALRLSNVSTPDIKIYTPPQGKATKAAMIVCPGGGYNILSYDMEGSEICEWLNGLGITAVLLKYRVPRREGQEKHVVPLQDVQRALRYIRTHAATMNLDPQKIGVMGFSAGAHLSVMASTAYDSPTYAPIDEIDNVSCKPNFCLLVYPAYLSAKDFQLAPEVKVTPQTPPTMIVQTQDDKNYIDSSIFYYYALKQNKVPVTMHLYSKGGHGYGLRNTGAPVNEWPRRAETWLKALGCY